MPSRIFVLKAFAIEGGRSVRLEAHVVIAVRIVRRQNISLGEIGAFLGETRSLAQIPESGEELLRAS